MLIHTDFCYSQKRSKTMMQPRTKAFTIKSRKMTRVTRGSTRRLRKPRIASTDNRQNTMRVSLLLTIKKQIIIKVNDYINTYASVNSITIKCRLIKSNVCYKMFSSRSRVANYGRDPSSGTQEHGYNRSHSPTWYKA